PPRAPPEHRTVERGEGEGAVPPGRPDGAGRARRGAVQPGTAAQSLHAVRARRRAELASTDTGGRARGRYRSDPDGEPEQRAAAGPDARPVRGADRPPGGRQHQLQHRWPPDGGQPGGRPRMLRRLSDRPLGPRTVRGAAARERGMTLYTVVVPTTGRQSLSRTLAALDRSQGPPPEEIVVVDDRSRADPPLQLPELDTAVRILRTGGAGPAAARNAGWRAAKTDWIVFLDDDVVPSPSWREDLLADLDVLPTEVAGCQGSIVVPLPEDRRPTDDERGTAGLAAAWWITADMAFRREALRRAGGFDEGFPRDFREDADMALRVQNLGYRLVNGRRTTEHPAPPAGFFPSVSAQAVNADNALMRAKHGPRWRSRIREGPGRTEQHFLTTAAALGALAAAARHRNPRWRKTFRGSLGVWALMPAEFTLRRILAGPRTPVEIARMVVTSVLIPPVACWYRLQGELRCRRRKLPAAVLFDRDDTLVHDVPYNSDPARVRAVPAVREALDQLRANEV